MRPLLKTSLKSVFVLAILALVLRIGASLYQNYMINPKVEAEIRENPSGARAARSMLLTVSADETYPVNYLRENNLVFVGIDGTWWRMFDSPTGGSGHPVSMLIQGANLTGNARVVLDDPDYTISVFKRLRPKAPEWLPLWLNGKLVVITLADENQ